VSIMSNREIKTLKSSLAMESLFGLILPLLKGIGSTTKLMAMGSLIPSMVSNLKESGNKIRPQASDDSVNTCTITLCL